MATPDYREDSLCVTETISVSFEFDWEIKNYKSHIKDVGQSLKTAKFSVKTDNRLKWFLVAYPNGKQFTDRGYFSLFVNCERRAGIAVPVPTVIQIGVYKKGGGGCDTSFINNMTINENDKNVNEWGWNRYVKSIIMEHRFNGLLPTDTLVVSCKIIFPTQSFVNAERLFPMSIPECSLRDNLESILEKESFCDVKLAAQGKEFNVHKVILAAASSVFSAMFSVESKEKKEGVVEVTDMEANVLESMLKFVYTGKIDFESIELSSGLLVAADKYGMERLKCLCEDYLCSKLTVENVSELLVLAHLHDAQLLLAMGLDFANLNIFLVRKTIKWKTLVKGHPQLLDEIFEHHLLFHEQNEE